ncbi:hypothetical protein BJ165DRAFT_1524805 [Panaeolus papilionaceus]|nr:hypothetical protein BJ165DRAFT_1524805 [Panaeolus papilionaceus]
MAQANCQLDILLSPGSSPSSSPPIVHGMLVETNTDIEIPNKPPARTTAGPSQYNSVPMADVPMADVPMAVDTNDTQSLPHALSKEEDRVWDQLLCQMPLDAWFQVEDVVFSLEISRYITESAYMAGLYCNAKEYLEMHPTPPHKLGVSKECPIVINGVKKEDMNLFVGALKVSREWGAGSAKGKHYTKEEVTQCIALAQMWELTSLEEQFYRQLDLPDQSPAFRIYAAVKFKDVKLVSIPTLRLLVFTPMNEPPNVSDLKRMTYDMYCAVTFARDTIMTQRAAIAAHFPTITKINDQDHRHSVCIEKCHLFWRTHLTKLLLEGREPAIDAQESFIEAMWDESTMNQACKKHLISELMKNADWKTRWGKEDYVLRKLKERLEMLIKKKMATNNLTTTTSSGIVLMVEGTRFYLSCNELAKFSDVFRGMFFDAPDIGSMQEGSIENPVVLQNIKRQDFAPLALWIRYGAEPPRGYAYTEKDLLSMLFLADQWSMSEVEKFCFEGIARLLHDPFFLLKLAVGYWRWDMVKDLIRWAVKVPSLDWRFQYPAIDEPIMKLKIRLEEVRRRCAVVPETIPQDEECTSHVTCTLRWKSDWRLNVFEQLFHPDHPLPMKECYPTMVHLSPKPSACRRLALDALLQRGDEFEIEDDLYLEAENEINRAHQ